MGILRARGWLALFALPSRPAAVQLAGRSAHPLGRSSNKSARRVCSSGGSAPVLGGVVARARLAALMQAPPRAPHCSGALCQPTACGGALAHSAGTRARARFAAPRRGRQSHRTFSTCTPNLALYASSPSVLIQYALPCGGGGGGCQAGAWLGRTRCLELLTVAAASAATALVDAVVVPVPGLQRLVPDALERARARPRAITWSDPCKAGRPPARAWSALRPSRRVQGGTEWEWRAARGEEDPGLAWTRQLPQRPPVLATTPRTRYASRKTHHTWPCALPLL